MKFTGSILALLAGSAAGFAPLGGPSTAFTPSTDVMKNQPTALNAMFEVVIGTGSQTNGGTDADVFLTLYDKYGGIHRLQPMAGSGRDNYEKGSIDINTVIDFPGIDEPTKFRFDVGGDSWSYGGVWVTNLQTGRCYCHVADGYGSMIGSHNSLTSDLTDLHEEAGDAFVRDEYPLYKLDITTGNDGTSDDVFCKVIDVKGVANSIMKPGEPDNVLNPVRNWDAGSVKSARTSTNSGVDLTMSDAKYVLVAKYGTDQWNPTKINVTGLNGKLLGGDGYPQTVFPGEKLNRDNKKWRWMKV